jgi:hypothetical protein
MECLFQGAAGMIWPGQFVSILMRLDYRQHFPSRRVDLSDRRSRAKRSE